VPVAKKAIIDIATPLGISVHDHIIVGNNGHASLKGLKLIQLASQMHAVSLLAHRVASDAASASGADAEDQIVCAGAPSSHERRRPERSGHAWACAWQPSGLYGQQRYALHAELLARALGVVGDELVLRIVFQTIHPQPGRLDHLAIIILLGGAADTGRPEC
jgi:hypothetical protein